VSGLDEAVKAFQDAMTGDIHYCCGYPDCRNEIEACLLAALPDALRAVVNEYGEADGLTPAGRESLTNLLLAASSRLARGAP